MKNLFEYVSDRQLASILDTDYSVVDRAKNKAEAVDRLFKIAKVILGLFDDFYVTESRHSTSSGKYVLSYGVDKEELKSKWDKKVVEGSIRKMYLSKKYNITFNCSRDSIRVYDSATNLFYIRIEPNGRSKDDDYIIFYGDEKVVEPLEKLLNDWKDK